MPQNKSFKSIFLKFSFSMLIFVFFALVIQIGKYMALPKTTYEIPPKVCVALFGENPTVFATHADTFFPWTDDFCLSAKVKSNGTLMLELSEKQQKKWRDQYSRAIQLLKEQDGIIVSDDYKKVVLYYPSSLLTKDLMEISQAPHGLFSTQLLNGEEPSTMHILFQVVKKDSGEILYQADWPYEEFHWDADNY